MSSFLYDFIHFLHGSPAGIFLIFITCAILAFVLYRIIKFFFGSDEGIVSGDVLLFHTVDNPHLLTDIMNIAFTEKAVNLKKVRIQYYGQFQIEDEEGNCSPVHNYLVECLFEGNARKASKGLVRGLYLSSIVIDGLDEYLNQERKDDSSGNK